MFTIIPFIEECVFRLAIPLILKDLEIKTICTFSSVMFSLIHLSNLLFVPKKISVFIQALMTFALGVIIYHTESFYLGILYHMYYNTMSLSLCYFLFSWFRREQPVQPLYFCMLWINRSKSTPPKSEAPIEFACGHTTYIASQMVATEHKRMGHLLDCIKQKRNKSLKDVTSLFNHIN
jgi:hypothetical protein